MVPGIAFYICDNYKESKINGQFDEARVHKGLEGCFAGILDTTYLCSTGLVQKPMLAIFTVAMMQYRTMICIWMCVSPTEVTCGECKQF